MKIKKNKIYYNVMGNVFFKSKKTFFAPRSLFKDSISVRCKTKEEYDTVIGILGYEESDYMNFERFKEDIYLSINLYGIGCKQTSERYGNITISFNEFIKLKKNGKSDHSD